jgi:hypothetical protein
MNLSEIQHIGKTEGATALEQLPHLLEKVCLMWGHTGFDDFVNRLIMDSRDGQRRGLPLEAARDLMFLVEVSNAKRALVASEVTGVPYEKMFARCVASSQNVDPSRSGGADPWVDPAAHKDVGRMGRSRSKRAPSGSRREPVQPSWWHRVFG